MRHAGPVLAALVLGGLALGLVTLLPSGPALAAAVAAASLACVAPSHRGATALLALAGVCAAAAHGAAARDRALQPPVLAWFNETAGALERLAAPVVVEGTLAADAALTDEGVRLVVDVVRVRDATEWRRAPGRVRIHVAGAQGAGHLRDWSAGRRVRAPVTLRRPQVLLNFGGPSPFWQQLRRPFVLAGSVKSAALVEVEHGAWWAEVASRARWRARDAAARFVAPRDPQAAGIVRAIVIGDRAGLDESVVRRLQAAGTYHVIAISGGNVALLTGLCFALLGLALRSPRLVAGATLALTVAYAGIVGGEPSVARAVTAAAVYLGAAVAGLPASPLATVRTTACALAAVNPLMVVDVGAWLSFGATAGILVLAARFADVVSWRGVPPWCRAAGRPIVVLVAATAAAELVLVPIAASVFGRVTMAGLVLNVVAIPAMAVVEVAGLATVILGPWAPWAGHAAAAVAAGAAQALVSSSALTEAWPWLSWRVPAVSPWWIATYYVAAGLAWRARGSRGLGRAALVAAAVALGVIAFAPAADRARPAAGRLRVTLIDVGQGDATLIQCPNGDALLVDAGGRPGSFDVGARVVTPAALALGARSLTWLALTHPDLDHIGGGASVAEDLVPREIWEGVPVPRDPDLIGLRRLADARGIAWRRVLAGARLEVGGRVSIEAVHPPEPEWERQRSRNEDSMVLRVRYGRVDVLLTGDAGAEFENRLPADLSASPIRILKAGHHGSRTSTGDRIVRAMRPQVALISVGRGNVFGQPAPDVLARLAAAGSRIFRTDLDGAISVETDGVTVRIRTALGRSWTVAALGDAGRRP